MKIKLPAVAITLVACVVSSNAAAGRYMPQTDYSLLQYVSKDDGVTIIFIKNKRSRDDVPRRYRNPSREMIALAQSEIRTNRWLRAILVSKRVQLHNVVAIETALNGGKIVYIR